MRSFPALVFTGLLLAGCSSSRPEVANEPLPATAAYDRPGDGLLDREDLQDVVERQTRRDSSALRLMLRDEDPAIRARAAFAIGSVQDASAVPALLLLLDNPEPRVRADAAFAIGQSADSTAALELLGALRYEPDPAVQRLLLEALGKTGGQATLRVLPTLDLPGLDADRALAIARYGLRGVHDRAATDWVVERLTSPSARVRESAAYGFSRLQDPEPWVHAASDVLAASDGLEVDDPAQMYLALAIGRLDHKSIEFRRIRLLTQSTDWRIRANAARALAQPNTTGQAQDALLAALDDASVHVASAAAGALAAADTLTADRLDQLERWIGAHPSAWRVWAPALPALAKAGRTGTVLRWTQSLRPSRGTPAAVTEREQPFAYAAALAAIGQIPGAAARNLLASAAADDDARIAYAALAALDEHWEADRTAASAPLYFRSFADGVRRRDLATAFVAAPALADSLFRPLGASAVLRETYEQMTVPDDIEPMVEIVRAIGEVQDTTAVGFLLSVALEGPHPTIRQAAAETLSERFGEGVDFEATGLAPPAFPVFDWDRLRGLGRRPVLTLQTDRGEIAVELDTEAAPMTVQLITQNAEDGRYDGVPFHRVVQNFVIQGGDYVRADGFGGPGYFLPSEFTRLPYRRGTLGMASAGKDTEGSQYFVAHSPQPHLDGRYTAFGRVVRGQAVVDQILQGDRVLEATVTPGL